MTAVTMGGSDTDAVLLDRFRAGDPRAFEKIVRRHRQRIYAVARRMLGSHEEADEAAQITFVRAWQGIGRFRGDASLGTWLTRIVVNVARTRRSANRASVGSDGASLADPAEGSDARVERQQVRRRVRRAVATLPPRQREVILLKVFSEMTYREVAEALELSEGAVKAHVHQAVSNLRRRMAVEQGTGSRACTAQTSKTS